MPHATCVEHHIIAYVHAIGSLEWMGTVRTFLVVAYIRRALLAGVDEKQFTHVLRFGVTKTDFILARLNRGYTAGVCK